MGKPVTAEAWAAGRALYACPGASLDDIAIAMGVTVATVRRRARAAGWVPAAVDLPAEGAAGHAVVATGGVTTARAAIEPAMNPADTQAERLTGPGMASAVSRAIAAADKSDTTGAAGTAKQAVASDDAPGAVAAGESDVPDEVKLSAAALRQVDMVLAAAEAGRIDKARIDAVMAMIRLATEAANLARDGAGNKKTRSDEQLADTLRRIDERIVQLAQGYAERLVAERDPC